MEKKQNKMNQINLKKSKLPNTAREKQKACDSQKIYKRYQVYRKLMKEKVKEEYSKKDNSEPKKAKKFLFWKF